MAILHFVYVSFSTMFMLVSTVLVGFMLTMRLSAPHRTSRGLSYVTLRIFLSSMLFGNLCLDISPQFMRRYYWASIMSLVPMLLGAAFAYSLRRLVMKEWRVLLLLGSTFQNGLIFPLSVVTNLRGVAWLDARARKDCQQYVFLYNLTCALGLWAIGSPLIKYHKDKLVARRAEALAASMDEVSQKQNNEQIRDTTSNVELHSLAAAATSADAERPVNLTSCPGQQHDVASVDAAQSAREGKSVCHAPSLNGDKSNNNAQCGENRPDDDISAGQVPWRTTATRAMSHYQPARHLDRPIAMVKYDRAYRYTALTSSPVTQAMPPCSSSAVQASNAAATTDTRTCPQASTMQSTNAMQRRTLHPRPWTHYIWHFINRAVVSRDRAAAHYRHRPTSTLNVAEEEEEEDIRLYHHERPLSVHLQHIGRVVWGALMTVPVKLTLLAIAISLVPPLRWVAQSPPGQAILLAIAKIGKACVPSQLLLLGIILGIRHKHDDLAEDDLAERAGQDDDTEDEQNARVRETHNAATRNTAGSMTAVQLSWWRRKVPNSVRFMAITIILRLLCIPALSFLLVHMLLRWRVLPTDKPFVVSILIGTSSPAAVNASLVCTMHQYHASAFSRMMIWMHCIAIVTSTFWLTVSIAYTNALPD